MQTDSKRTFLNKLLHSVSEKNKKTSEKEGKKGQSLFLF